MYAPYVASVPYYCLQMLYKKKKKKKIQIREHNYSCIPE